MTNIDRHQKRIIFRAIVDSCMDLKLQGNEIYIDIIDASWSV